MKLTTKPKRILDLDLENRPLTYLGSDYTTGDITAIAWSFGRRVECRLLGEYTTEEILGDFLIAYDSADLVTGHYIRGYDLPVINGALLEFGFPPLSLKLTQDTKMDLVNRKYVSASQESLAGMLGIGAPKIQMDQTKWREANRLTPAGLAYTRERVVGDVRQHMELRLALLERGWLKSPKPWRGQLAGGYTP